jgi:hypothetical protein
VYENTDWVPIYAQLSEGAADASSRAGFDSLVRANLSGSTAVLGTAEGPREVSGAVEAGTVFVGESVSSGWELEVDGAQAERSPAFGWANAFEVPAGGTATLRYAPSVGRWVLVVLQALAWLAAIWLATRSGTRARPQRGRPAAVAPPAPSIIDLGPGDEPDAVAVPVPVGGEPDEASDGSGDEPEVHWGADGGVAAPVDAGQADPRHADPVRTEPGARDADRADRGQAGPQQGDDPRARGRRPGGEADAWSDEW